MSEEEKTVHAEGMEEEPEATEERAGASQEFRVKAQDLFQTINDIIREGTARRITVTRNNRILLDIPLVVGVTAGALMAFYMPLIAAIAAVGALFGGCTVRIDRDEPAG